MLQRVLRCVRMLKGVEGRWRVLCFFSGVVGCCKVVESVAGYIRSFKGVVL